MTQSSLSAQGIAAYERGENKKARELLEKAIETEAQNENAWYYLSKLVSDPVRRKKMLQQVLKINSKHRAAQYELAVITSELRASPPQIKPAEEADTLHSPNAKRPHSGTAKLQPTADKAQPKGETKHLASNKSAATSTVTIHPKVKTAHKIESDATVTSEGYVYLKLQVDLPPGDYKAVIVLEEK